MGGIGDVSDLFTDEELADSDRPTPTVPLMSPAPASGDSDELEFDLLGATSLRPEDFEAPVVVRPSTVPVALPVPAPRVSASPPAFTPSSLTPPPVSRVAPAQGRSPIAAPLPRTNEIVPDLESVPELVVPAPEPTPPTVARHVSFPPPDTDFDPLDDSFDEILGFGALSQQNFAIKTEVESDVPWPTGVTADMQGVSIPPAALDGLAGFPEPPGSGPLQMLYFFAVRSAQKQLTLRLTDAEEALLLVETNRDAALADLAERLRAQLSSNPRFEVLYKDAGSFETSAQSKRGRLDARDHDLSERLRKSEVQIENARAAVLAQAQKCQLEERAYEEADRAQKRAVGLAGRAQIEMRNLARLARERAPGQAHMPPDLGEKYRIAESQYATYTAQADAQESIARQRRAALEAERDQARRLEAELGRFASEKEAMVMTYEGDVRALLSELDQSERARSARLADAGRALLRLRGEVPVDEATRRVLLGHDEAVQAAARKLESLRRALTSFDQVTFEAGRKWLMGSAAALFVLLLWLALR